MTCKCNVVTRAKTSLRKSFSKSNEKGLFDGSFHFRTEEVLSVSDDIFMQRPFMKCLGADKRSSTVLFPLCRATQKQRENRAVVADFTRKLTWLLQLLSVLHCSTQHTHSRIYNDALHTSRGERALYRRHVDSIRKHFTHECCVLQKYTLLTIHKKPMSACSLHNMWGRGTE